MLILFDAYYVQNHGLIGTSLFIVTETYPCVFTVLLYATVLLWSCFTGQITQSESIFTYEMDEGVANFSDPNHVPPFLDEILSNLMGNSTLTDVCGDNVECLFDFAQTGDMEVAMAAMTVENETATEMQESCK